MDVHFGIVKRGILASRMGVGVVKSIITAYEPNVDIPAVREDVGLVILDAGVVGPDVVMGVA